MHLSQELAALRIDPRPQIQDQRRVVVARDAWRNEPSTQRLIHELECYGGLGSASPSASDGLNQAQPAGFSPAKLAPRAKSSSAVSRADHGTPADLLSGSPELAALFNEPGRAAAFVHHWAKPMLHALSEAPLGHAAFRHMHSGENTVLQLFHFGRAELSLVLVAGAAPHYQRKQQSLLFTDSERHEVVIGGCAAMRLVERSGPDAGPAHFAYDKVQAGDDTVIRRIGARQALLVDQVDGYLLRLRLTRTPARPHPSREYRLSDGKLLHISAGHRSDSQKELAMAVLSAMGYRRASAKITAIATSDGPVHLRWEALRQAIALDSGDGFAALCKVADNPQDALKVPASKLRAQLVQSYPALQGVQCPA